MSAACESAIPPAEPVSERGLYPRLLGGDWEGLAECVRLAHCQVGAIRGTGMMQISGPSSLVGRLVARTLGLPEASDSLEVVAEIQPTEGGEVWLRRFGRRTICSVQSATSGGLLAERIGLLVLYVRLIPDAGGIRYEQVRAAVGLGRICVPLPGWLAPRVIAAEHPDEETEAQTRLHIYLSLPPIGDLLSYRGSVRWERMSG